MRKEQGTYSLPSPPNTFAIPQLVHYYADLSKEIEQKEEEDKAIKQQDRKEREQKKQEKFQRIQDRKEREQKRDQDRVQKKQDKKERQDKMEQHRVQKKQYRKEREINWAHRLVQQERHISSPTNPFPHNHALFWDILNIYIPLFGELNVNSSVSPNLGCTPLSIANSCSTPLHLINNQFTNANPNHGRTTQKAQARDENTSLDVYLGMLD